MLERKKIFVTGGNGFIGSRVVSALVEGGYAVRCLLRETSRTSRIDALDFEKVIGDITIPETLVPAIEGCEGIIHLASLSNWTDIHSSKMQKVVVQGSQNVLNAAKKAGNLPVVYVSSSTAINGTRKPELLNETSTFDLNKKTYSYAYAKKRVEAFCIKASQAGLPVVIVNPAEVYGPNDEDQITCGNLLDFAKSNPVFVCKGGTSIVHVDDVAAGILAAFEKGRPGERYFLGGENVSIKELASKTLEILGQRKRIVTVPNGLIRFIAKAGKALSLPLPFNPEVIPYATKYWYVDNTKAKTELGIHFRSAEEALKPALNWLVKEEFLQDMLSDGPR